MPRSRGGVGSQCLHHRQQQQHRLSVCFSRQLSKPAGWAQVQWQARVLGSAGTSWLLLRRDSSRKGMMGSPWLAWIRPSAYKAPPSEKGLLEDLGGR